MRKSPPTWLSLSRLSPLADPVLDRLSAPETLLDAVKKHQTLRFGAPINVVEREPRSATERMTHGAQTAGDCSLAAFALHHVDFFW